MSSISKSESTPKSALREGMQEIKRDAKGVREDLGALKDDASQLTSHATGHAIDAVKAGVHSAGEVATSTGEKFKEAHNSMNDQVRARPTASVLIALGAGVLIGRVLAATRH